MSLSLKIVAGVCVYYILLGVCLGKFGIVIANEATESSVSNDIQQFDDVNVSTDISITHISSFWEGLAFSVDNMPWFVTMFLSLVIPVVMTLAVLWAIRGI